MISYQLTGKARYRVHTRWFKPPLIVMQVEIHRKGYELTDSYGGTTQDFDDYIWRDARLEDLKLVCDEEKNT
jgi:hypothetical protein